MKKINLEKIFKFLEKKYFLLFFIILIVFLAVSFFFFYKNYILLTKEKFSIKKIQFKEKELSKILEEIRKREEEFNKIKGIEIQDIFNY